LRQIKIIVVTLLAGVAIYTGYAFFNHGHQDESQEKQQQSYVTEEAVVDLEFIDHQASYAEIASRKSSVQVHNPDFRGFGSGTYFVQKGRHFILTAAHVVDDKEHMMISGRDEIVPGRVVYTNPATDIAVIEVDKMNTRDPVRLRVNGNPHVGDAVAYTGFPNGTDLLTITGRISGYRGSWVVIQSYTWMGASGSGVFDSRGRLVGVVSMVEIGHYRAPQVIEDVGYVAKISEADVRGIRGL